MFEVRLETMNQFIYLLASYIKNREIIICLINIAPVIILGSVIVYALLNLSKQVTEHKIRREAVDAGVAIYTTDKYGKNREFKWLTNYTVVEMPAAK